MTLQEVGCGQPLHAHAWLQLSVPIAGDGFHATFHDAGGRPVRVRPRQGEACLTPAGQLHTLGWEGRGGFVSLKLAPELVAGALAGEPDPAALDVVPAYGTDDAALVAAGAALAAHVRAWGGIEPAFAESLAIAAAGRIAERHLARPRPLRRSPRLSGADLARVTNYVDAHLGERIAVADLASLVGLSPFHFARAFRRARGLAPHGYLVRARVERARTLLRTTDEPIGRIALRAGFTHQSHLTRVFRRVLGTTPGRERRAVS